MSLARGPLAPAHCREEVGVGGSQAQWELGFCLSIVSPLMEVKSLNTQDRKGASVRIRGRTSGSKGNQAWKQRSARVGRSLTLNRQSCPRAPRPRVQTLGRGYTASQVAGQQLVLLATRQSLTHSSDSACRKACFLVGLTSVKKARDF